MVSTGIPEQWKPVNFISAYYIIHTFGELIVQTVYNQRNC